MKDLILKIRAFFGSLALDKVEHVFLSFLCCIILGGIFNLCGITHDLTIYLALAVSFFIGVLKEVLDRVTHLGMFSWDDILADFIGIVLGILYLALFVI